MQNYNPNYKKNSPKQYRNQPTVLETIVVGIFKAIWFLITLPFKKKGKKQGISAEDKAELISRRVEIERLSSSGNEIELKHAVMEADKLVDYVLQLKGYGGETFADRLRSAQQYIDRATYQAIWEGHKVRNQLAHENGVQVSQMELRQAVTNLLNYIHKS
jgi:hypothetical protein